MDFLSGQEEADNARNEADIYVWTRSAVDGSLRAIGSFTWRRWQKSRRAFVIWYVVEEVLRHDTLHQSQYDLPRV